MSTNTKQDLVNKVNALIIENAQLRAVNNDLTIKLKQVIYAHNRRSGPTSARRAEMQAAKAQARDTGKPVVVQGELHV